MLDTPQPSELSDLVRLQRAELEERLAGGLCPDATRELTGGRSHAGTGAAHLGADWRAWLTGLLTKATRRLRAGGRKRAAPAEPEIRKPDPRRRISSGRLEAVGG